MTLKFLLEKEFKQFFRNPLMPRFVAIYPLVVMFVMPWALTMDIKNLKVSVVDDDRSSMSGELVQKIGNSTYFNITSLAADFDAAMREVEYGDADIVVEIPAGFESDFVNLGATAVRISVNAVNGIKGMLGQSYMGNLIAQFAENQAGMTGAHVASAIQPASAVQAGVSPGISPGGTLTGGTAGVSTTPADQAASAIPPGVSATPTGVQAGVQAYAQAGVQTGVSPSVQPAVDVRVKNMYNPTLDFRRNSIPALIMIIMVVLCSFLPAVNIVLEKEQGTIEQINVTPVRKPVFILAKLIPFWTFGLVAVSLAFLLARILYGVAPAGSLATLYLFCGLFILTVTGGGLVVSNYSSTMQQATFLMFFFVVIFILMSGLLTPVRSMPDWAQAISAATPTRYIVEALRSIYIKGATLADLKTEAFTLAAMMLAFNTWAVLSYKKTS